MGLAGGPLDREVKEGVLDNQGSTLKAWKALYFMDAFDKLTDSHGEVLCGHGRWGNTFNIRELKREVVA